MSEIMARTVPHAVFTTDKEVGHFAPYRNDQVMVEEQSLAVTVLCTRTGPALCGHDLEAASLARTWAPTYGSELLASRPLVTMCSACEAEAGRLLAGERQ